MVLEGLATRSEWCQPFAGGILKVGSCMQQGRMQDTVVVFPQGVSTVQSGGRLAVGFLGLVSSNPRLTLSIWWSWPLTHLHGHAQVQPVRLDHSSYFNVALFLFWQSRGAENQCQVGLGSPGNSSNVNMRLTEEWALQQEQALGAPLDPFSLLSALQLCKPWTVLVFSVSIPCVSYC